MCAIGVTCSEVIVTNADKTPDKASYTYNEAVTYSCNPGYQRTNGDSVKRCVNMNTWIGSYPICTGTCWNVNTVFFKTIPICSFSITIFYYIQSSEIQENIDEI